MTIAGDLVAEGAKVLSQAGIVSARVEARILLAFVLGMKPNEIVSTTHLPLAGRSEITDAQRSKFPGGGVSPPEPPPGSLRDPTSPQGGGASVEQIFSDLIARRATHEPISYITGVREFWSLDFEVGPGVLIPRPETETLIEQAILEFPDKRAPLSALDLGTGSGCIPIAFLSEYPNAHAIAVDASPAALIWARRNIKKHDLQTRCGLRINQWTDGLSETFDVIFSNPPYIEHDTIPTLDADVSNFEPLSALDGGSDGYDAYRELAPRIASHLKQSGRAFVELGKGQDETVCAIFAAAGLETIHVAPDLSGTKRCLAARRSA